MNVVVAKELLKDVHTNLESLLNGTTCLNMTFTKKVDETDHF